MTEALVRETLSVCGRRWGSVDFRLSQCRNVAEEILTRRGFAAAEFDDILSPRMRDLMADPDVIPDMAVASQRLSEALLEHQGITILADFDVDGASSAALLFRYCQFFGLRPLIEVPERLTEGFGPNRRILDDVVGRGSDLLLCLDCGTAAVELFADYVNRLDSIIVDHHQLEKVLPDVLGLVNPQCSSDGIAAFGDLAAVGVTFMLLVATNRRLKEAGAATPDLKESLDLVALGSICDMVPMRGLNRAFVHRGLERINSTPCAGLAALMQTSGLKQVRAEDISFSLGPKLNAASRQGFSSLAWQLLVQDNPEQARQFALKLGGLNKQRKEESLALAAVAQEVLQQGNGFALASGEGWPLGILGILAGRLSRRLHQPCFVMSYDDTGAGSGSARSIPGCDLASLLHGAVDRGILTRGGGHAMAGGFGLERTQEAAFFAFLEEKITESAGEIPAHDIDACLCLNDCTLQLLYGLQRLEPFGVGHPEPLFLLEDIGVRRVDSMGTEHLRIEIVDSEHRVLPAVLFNEANSALGRFLREMPRDIALLVRLKSDFRRSSRVVAHIEDAALSVETVMPGQEK